MSPEQVLAVASADAADDVVQRQPAKALLGMAFPPRARKAPGSDSR